ncbi:MAG: ABC-type transport auxiliary lipoprotein family protein [Burkholderiales bacterium]
MNGAFPCRRVVRAAMVAATLLAAGCSTVLPKPAPSSALYVIEAERHASAGASPASPTGPTLVVEPVEAAAGFDTARMVYTRKPHQLESFAHSAWIDTPARMLSPLIVAAVGGSGAFRAVVMAPSAAAGDLRLETELLRLQQEFGAAPSRVQLTLRATLTDIATRQVLGRQDFDARTDAPSEDAYGGVFAANRAAEVVLEALAAFCADAARRWQPPLPVR